MSIVLSVLLVIIVVLVVILIVLVSISKEFVRRTAMYLDKVKQLRDIIDILFLWLPQDNREDVIENYLIDHGYLYPCIYDMRNLGQILLESMQNIEPEVFSYIEKRKGDYCMLDLNAEEMDSKSIQKVDIVVVADKYVSKLAKDNIQRLVQCPIVSLGEIIEEQKGKTIMNKSEMKVSVIVPVYNVEKYLPECVQSLLDQTLDKVEIVLVDDGSNDGSGKMIDEYAERHPNIVAIHQENSKLGAARNHGLSVARGEYIAYLDSDDFLTQDALEKLYNLAVRKRLDVISFDAQPFFQEGVQIDGVETLYDRSNLEINFEKVWKGSEYWNENYRKGGVFINACFSFCRREFLLQNNFEFQPGVFYEDNEFGMKLYLCAKRFMCLPEKFYCRRYRPGSITTSEMKTIHLVSRLVSVKCIWKHIIQYSNEIKQGDAAYTFFSSNLNRILDVFYKIREVDYEWFIKELISFNDFIWQNESIVLGNYDVRIINPVVEFLNNILADKTLNENLKKGEKKELEKTVHISETIAKKKLKHIFEKMGISEEQKICIYGTGIIGKRVSNSIRKLLGELFSQYVFYAQTSVAEETYDECRVLAIDTIGSENVGVIIVATTKYVEEMLCNLKKLYGDKYRILTYEQLMSTWG